LGHTEDAITQFQRGVDHAPDNAIAYFNLGIAKMRLDRLDEARKDLETSLNIEPTGSTYAALGSVLLLEGKYEKAAEMERKSIELKPNNYVAWGDLGTAYHWSGNKQAQAVQAYRKAIELAEAVHAKDRENPELLIALADYYAAVGNSERSLILIRQALAMAPENPSVEYQAGDAYETLGQRDKAIPLFAKAIAGGYRTNEFQRNPELAGLRADHAFAEALTAQQKKK
jgi:serine/threonine-protein kinase